MSTEVDDFLAHYGVKGMKWGVRRDRSSSSSSSARSEAAGAVGKAALKSSMIIGASTVGSIVGGAIGQTVLGGESGKTIGSFVGTYAARGIAGSKAAKSEKKKRDAEVANFKASRDLPKRSPSYTDRMLNSDLKSFGPSGVKRINETMNSGKSHANSMKLEQSRQFKISAAEFGVSFATSSLINRYGGLAANSLASATSSRAAANRASRSRNNSLSDLKGLPSPLSPSRQGRDGSFRVTGLR